MGIYYSNSNETLIMLKKSISCGNKRLIEEFE